MQFTAVVDRGRGHDGLATVLVSGSANFRLDLDTDPPRAVNCGPAGGRFVSRCPVTDNVAADLLVVAACVYAVDRMSDRGAAGDRWTRGLHLEVPVSDPALWAGVKDALANCLSFLSGDRWTLAFSQRAIPICDPASATRHQPARTFRPDAVCLFSGGLDSFIGAIDWLEADPQGRLLLVGHYDGDVAGPRSQQAALSKHLYQHYGQRIELVQFRAGSSSAGAETSSRSRSLLFIAGGIAAAAHCGPDTPLLMPENGLIALNVPLTPSRRGSCSTRTAHPRFMDNVRQILTALGIRNPLLNPLQTKTKGECVVDCANQALLRAAASVSVSCAKGGRKGYWQRHNATSCGCCVPCIYRRAALHAANLDSEAYGLDICAGEVDPGDNKKSGDDLRALLSFLRRRHTEAEIVYLLRGNGLSTGLDATGHAQLVMRGMDEVRALLRDKGTADSKQRAGL